MNVAEGEKFDNQPEQSDIQDQYYENENIENLSQNSNNSHNHSFSCEDMEEFTNSVLEADISEPCVKGDEDYFQSSFRIDSENYNEESSTASNAELLKNGTSTDEYDFDINSIDFTIKTYRESTISSSEKRNQPLQFLPSIFESNSDLDESLDF